MHSLCCKFFCAARSAGMGAGASSGLRADKATADELFKKADKDQNGVLSLDELCEAASAHGEETKKAWGRERIMDTIQKYDRDGDNQLDPSEWSQAFIELTKAPSADEEMSSSVWEYQGTARNAKNNGLFGNYTIRRALFNPEAHPATTSTGAITLDCEYCAASQGSVGGYRERFDLRWNTKTGELGWKGASWKGYLVDGPGSKLDLKNKWGNLIVLEPVCQLPDSAVMDEDNDPQEEDIEPLAAEQRVMGEAVDAARWPVVLDFLEKPVLPVKVRNEMTEGEVSKAQVEAGAWLVKALDAAPSREGLPALVKRLLSVYRFANQMPMDAFRPLVQLASERLDILGKPLNELYATQDLKGQLGGLGGAALGAKVRQHDIVPTPKTRGFFYPESSQTYDTASQARATATELLSRPSTHTDTPPPPRRQSSRTSTCSRSRGAASTRSSTPLQSRPAAPPRPTRRTAARHARHSHACTISCGSTTATSARRVQARTSTWCGRFAPSTHPTSSRRCTTRSTRRSAASSYARTASLTRMPRRARTTALSTQSSSSAPRAPTAGRSPTVRWRMRRRRCGKTSATRRTGWSTRQSTAPSRGCATGR